ncbi:hypothetical protein J4E91_010705 [Alternaria rosae]|nr:hypothetical protein J4E91_010705 [Alternaria rosae]
MGVENDYTQFTPKLEELMLTSFAFTHAFVPLSMIINFHRLVRLQLLGSSGGSQDVFVELAESIEDDDRLRLKHLAVELAGDVLSDEIPPLKLALIRIYRACEPLESFHIRVSHVDIALLDLLLALNIPPHNLQSLSFHTSEWNWGRYNQDAVDMLFRVSQDRFRQVKQLAVYFEEAAMLGGLWGEEGNFAILMTFLREFRELRLLHLCLPHSRQMGRSENEWDPALLVLQLQTFANRFFEFIGPESKLDALVIGHVATLKSPENPPVHRRPLPQQCFLRGEQRDILGRTVPVAVPVTRMMLRETQPYTDILEVDHHSAADNWEAWATRAM